MNSDRGKFLRNEFMTLTLNGALSRSRTYIATPSNKAAKDKFEKDKEALRKDLREKLYAMEEKYRSAVEEKDHITNIETLANNISMAHSACLVKGRFRIGVAQKAINLYLKYLWCIKSIPLPPHCPFDSRIIEKLPDCDKIKWTKFDTIGEYMKLVRAVQAKAGSRSLTEWELESWNKTI